jgi:hypothetical protein
VMCVMKSRGCDRFRRFFSSLTLVTHFLPAADSKTILA